MLLVQARYPSQPSQRRFRTFVLYNVPDELITDAHYAPGIEGCGIIVSSPAACLLYWRYTCVRVVIRSMNVHPDHYVIFLSQLRADIQARV